jgi:hypothetical protein
LPLRWVGIGVGALALAVSGLWGGLSPVSSEIPQLKPGAVDKGQPWNVTVITCRVESPASLDPLEVQKTGDRWFVVLATVEVSADDSRTDIGDAIRVPDVPGLRSQQPTYVVLARDATEVPTLNPGMPERLGFIWEESGDVPLPATAMVKIYGKTLRTSTLTGQNEWLDPAVRAEVNTPVEDKRT